MSEFEKRLLTQAREQAKRNLAHHTVRQRHRDGDAVRWWRCDNNGSAVYHFNIYAPPGWLIMTGDMGECMWSRTPDMLSFIRGSIGSLDYFSEKASNDCKIKETHSELVDEFLRDFQGEYALRYGRPMTAELLDELSELRSDWDGDTFNVPKFQQAFYDSSLCNDCDDMPTVECYTFQYLWKIEALKWFITKLDAGEFVVEPYEWNLSVEGKP